MGPFPIQDVLGMKVAVAILDRSLDKGLYGAQVQWATFQKLMGGVINSSQAGVGGLGNSVGAYERNKMWISTSISHQFWFTRFMAGIHKRVGEIKQQGEAFTIEGIHQVKCNLESEWTKYEPKNVKEQKILAGLGVWFIVGFCCGMSDEEMLLIELAGTRNSLGNMWGDEGSFKVVISGCTKGNQV